MKIKDRMKNIGFWISLIGSIFLILGAFGVEIADETANAIINAVSSALVMLGIVSNPTSGKGYLDGDLSTDGDGSVGKCDSVDVDACVTLSAENLICSDGYDNDAPTDRNL